MMRIDNPGLRKTVREQRMEAEDGLVRALPEIRAGRICLGEGYGLIWPHRLKFGART